MPIHGKWGILISQSWFLTGVLKKLIEREREAHKQPQKIQDLKEGLAEFNFFSMLYNICSKMVINLVKTLDGWLCLLSCHYFKWKVLFQSVCYIVPLQGFFFQRSISFHVLLLNTIWLTKNGLCPCKHELDQIHFY